MTTEQWARQDITRGIQRDLERRWSTGVPGPAACLACGWTTYRSDGGVVRCSGCGAVLGIVKATNK
jgi:hypothetical protein